MISGFTIPTPPSRTGLHGLVRELIFSYFQLVPSDDHLFDKLKRFSELFLAPPKKGFQQST